MLKRPKPGEDEEDILRMQEEYLRQKNTNETFSPSAQVVNLRRTEHSTAKRSNTSKAGTRKPSLYAKTRGLEQTARDVGKAPTPERNDECDDQVYFPKINPGILGEIVQKNYDTLTDVDYQDSMPSRGFPTITKYDPDSAKQLSTRIVLDMPTIKQNESIDDKTPIEMEVDETSEPASSNQQALIKPLNLPTRSYILSNKDSDNIHSENVNIMSKLSEKEILDEQQKLLSALDPKLIEFLKARRNKTSFEMKEDSTYVKKEKQEEPVQKGGHNLEDDDEALWDCDILSHPQVNNWLHFDSLEKDKLQWMKGIKESRNVKPNEPYEARFDFHGYLLPYSVEYTEETKTLFHHGEEPHRPGYSITELIELSRSSIVQQRVMALNTIAGILEYHSAGMYKDVIEIPLSKIFFVVRFAMDENKVIIVEPALKAMRNMLYNKIDESCLDALIGFEEGTFQPCLENDKSEIEELESNESELKDFHLAEIDIIAALLRTDILQRLYYVIDIIRPSFNCVQYSLQILTRLARDSVDTANKIIQTDHLINAIMKNFIPVTGVNFRFSPAIVYNGKPVLAALKLMRILSLQSRDIGEMLISEYNILKPISEYISSGVDGSYGLHLQIEAYCILCNLIHYDFGVDYVISLLPVIMTALYKHVQGTDIFMNTVVVSSTHAAVVLQLVNKLFNCRLFDVEKYGSQIYPLIKEGLTKWMAQLSSIDSYTCGHLRVLCSALDCCNTIAIKVRVPVPFLINAIRSLSISRGMKNVIKNLTISSNLLSGIQEDSNLTKNLMILRGAILDSVQKVLPVLNITSPIPLLLSLFKVLVSINDKEIVDPYIEMILPYLRNITNVTPSLSLNWFTRMETDLVFNIVRLLLLNKTREDLKDIIYLVANKLCFILRSDKRYELQFLFDNIIFSKQWFPTERLFNLVSLSDADDFSKCLTSNEDIKLCYSNIINFKCFERTPSIVVRQWQEPVLPRDWIYLPILSLYSKLQETPTATVTGEHAKRVAQRIVDEKELILRCSLEWILFNELCFPDLLNDIDVTDRFCRIMCVFLCDNSLFLDDKIKVLLRKCVRVLFSKSKDFNFDIQLTGLNNFQDFYTQLLEQFQSVSYGDHNFAACVLVPLAQHHNVKWRKTLWSEYAGCLRALDCPEDYLCYDLNKYLYPEETDESLLKCYFRALSSNLLRPGTVVHKIASHHVECYKKRIIVTDNSV